MGILIGYVLTSEPEPAKALLKAFMAKREITGLKRISTYLQEAKNALCQCQTI
jgi:hypothetical protein